MATANLKVAALTLSSICLDVQISICMLLHPSDILALRKVCRHQKFSLLKSVKHLLSKTWERVVWVAALHRVCFDNTLFLPISPISDMSVLEIEKAAMGPRRWIEICRAYEKRVSMTLLQHRVLEHLKPSVICSIFHMIDSTISYFSSCQVGDTW